MALDGLPFTWGQRITFTTDGEVIFGLGKTLVVGGLRVQFTEERWDPVGLGLLEDAPGGLH
jgi:hypothetical protein